MSGIFTSTPCPFSSRRRGSNRNEFPLLQERVRVRWRKFL